MGNFGQFFAILTPLDPIKHYPNPTLRERTGEVGPFRIENKNFHRGLFPEIAKNPQKWAKFGQKWHFLALF